MIRMAAMVVGALAGALVLACGRGPNDGGTPATATAVVPTADAAQVTPTSVAVASVVATAAVAAATAAPDSQARPSSPPPDASSGRLVFAALNGAIYTVAPDGTDVRVLVEPDGPADSLGFRGALAWPVWSPDGETILYSALIPDGRRGLNVSLRTVPAAGGGETLLFQDDPATSGIGSGVAHYAYWSPDSRRVAVIAGTASGLTGELVNVASGERPATLADGAPIYYSWSSDSRHILVHHQEALRLYELDDEGHPVGSPRQIGSGSLDYFAPNFSPAGDRILYADTTDAVTKVFSSPFDGSAPTPMIEAEGRAAFAWAPDGRRVAVLSEQSEGLFDRLTVLTAGGRQIFRMDRKSMISFWWSPDATKLALTTVAQDAAGENVIAVMVIDVRDQSEAQVATLLPSDEFLFMQIYFDQFAHSIRMWSPDSTYLVLFGVVGDPLAQTAAYSSQEPMERAGVWVIDVTGSRDPVAVGTGYIGSWSPR
ncbi:MAG: PD40 domain-containing protein [Chloroflexi bacterium]|nr:PD40 domain-containing protein [Chloroflexota bacterium]